MGHVCPKTGHPNFPLLSRYPAMELHDTCSPYALNFRALGKFLCQLCGPTGANAILLQTVLETTRILKPQTKSRVENS